MKTLLLIAILLVPFHATSSERITVDRCISAASSKYHVHPDLIRAIIMTESGGRHGVIGKNTNATDDLGLMQINTIHLPELKRYGVTRDKLINDICYNIGTGTWLLSRHLAKAKSTSAGFWKAVGNYHSKTPALNEIYQKKVWKNLNKIREGQ